MNALASFLEMGGYARFVWPGYGLTALVLAGIVVTSLRRRRANRAALDTIESETGAATPRTPEQTTDREA